MHNLKPNSETWITFALSLFPPAGLIAAALAKLLHRASFSTSFFTLDWLVLWLGFGVPLALCQLILGRGASAVHIALLGAAGLFASAVLRVNKQSAAAGLLWGLVVLFALSAGNLLLNTLSWTNARVGQTSPASLGAFEGGKTRRWFMLGGANEVQLSFDARWLAGAQGLAWYRSHPGIRFDDKPAEATTHISFPTGIDPYIMRWIDTGKALGGRTFEATVELRSDQNVPTKKTRGLWLQVWSKPLVQESLATAVTPSWHTYNLQWTIPDGVEDSVLRLVLNDFDGLSLDVRNVALREQVKGRWISLSPLAPTGLTATLTTREVTKQLSVAPTKDAQTHTLVYTGGATRWVQVTFEAEPSLRIGLSDIGLTLDGGVALPQPLVTREQLWFTQPNLMGHTVTTLGLVLLVLTASRRTTFLGGLLVLTIIGLTGSRSAWLAMVAGVLGLLMFYHLQKITRSLLVGLLVVGTLGTGFWILLKPDLPSFSRDGSTSRGLIWTTALQALFQHPLRGLEEGFAPYFEQAQRETSNEYISHAHNLWLEFAALYGLPGLVAILWLTGGPPRPRLEMGTLARSRARRAGFYHEHL